MTLLERLGDADNQPENSLWDFPDVCAALTAHVARTPGKVAVIDPWAGRSITYGDLLGMARQAAEALGRHVPPGGAVGLTTTPGIDALVAYMAISLAGAAPVMMPTPETAAQTDAFAAVAGPWRKAVDFAAMLEATDHPLSGSPHGHLWYGNEAPLRLAALLAESSGAPGPVPAPSASATGHWIFSSGTTGPAKAIRLTRRAVAFNLAYTAASWRFDDTSCILGIGTPFHSAGLMVGYLMPVFAGATTVLMPPAQFGRNPAEALAMIARYGVTHLACPNSMIATLLREAGAAFAAADLSRFRSIIIGGDPLAETTLRGIRSMLSDNDARHVTVGTAFGMTEAAGLISSSGCRPPATGHVSVRALTEGRVEYTDHGRFFASGGPAQHGVSVCVVDGDGIELPPGQIGRVVFHSPSMFEAYEGQDSRFLTITRHSGDVLERAFPTGDLGFVTQGESGPEIVIMGREKETIAIGARRYFSLDIETLAAESCAGLSVDDVIAVSDPEEPAGILVFVERPGTGEDHQAQCIRDALVQAFPGPAFRVAVMAPGAFRWIPTSSKKPRLHTRAAFEAQSLSILAMAGTNLDSVQR